MPLLLIFESLELGRMPSDPYRLLACLVRYVLLCLEAGEFLLDEPHRIACRRFVVS